MTSNTSGLQRLSHWCWFLLLAASPLVYWPELHDISNPPKIAFIHGLVVILALVWILRSLRRGRILYMPDPLLLPLGAFWAVSAVSLLWAKDAYPGVITLFYWAGAAAGFLLYCLETDDPSFIDGTMRLLALGAAAVSAVGIVQYLSGWDGIPQAVLPAATFANKNVAMQFVATVFPLCLGIFLLERRKAATVLHGLALFLVLLYGFYCETRAAWVSMASSVALLAGMLFWTEGGRRIRTLFRPARAIAACALLALALVAVLLSPRVEKRAAEQIEVVEEVKLKRRPVAVTRLVSWRNALVLIGDHPFWGVGIGNLQTYYPLYHRAVEVDPLFGEGRQMVYMHNEPLQVLAETGVLGLLAYLAAGLAFLGCWRDCLRAEGVRPDIPAMALFAGLGVLSFFVDSLFSFPMRMALPPLAVSLLLAMLVKLRRLGQGVQGGRSLRLNGPFAVLLLAAVSAAGAHVLAFDARIIKASRAYVDILSYNSKGRWDLAREQGEKARKASPWDYRIRYELGRAYDHLGKRGEAISEYREVLEHQPYYINGLLNLGKVYEERGEYRKAMHFTDRALEILPDFPKAHFNAGVILERRGRLEQAIISYKRALQSAVSYPEAHFRLGIIYARKGMLEEAASRLEKAIEEKPALGEAYFNLGVIHLTRKDYSKALGYLEEAEKRGVRRASELIEKIRSSRH